jgi:ribokinase
MKKFCVIGSINIDMVATMPVFPASGQTLTGSSFTTAFGGKGANQAVALARLGAPVAMCGKIGADAFGAQYLAEFEKNGVDASKIGSAEGATGVAVIEVEDSGANRIVVVPGANGAVDLPYVETLVPRMREYGYFLYQLEIPLDSVAKAMAASQAQGGINVLDPAPARALPDEIYRNVDFITPNETETAILTGIKPADGRSIRRAAGFFFEKGVRNVIIKGGERGSWYLSPREAWWCPPFPLAAVDTTAAGDSFNAGFVYALDIGKEPQDAGIFANAVAGLAITKLGAQAAMPSLEETRKLLLFRPGIVARPLD